jgi:hypothetical protein
MSDRPSARVRVGVHVRQAQDSAAAFRAVLDPAPVRLVAATSLVARLPKGMVSLATVLLLRQSAGSYAIAGIAVALTALGDAASAPAQGWLADRLGCGRVLIPTAAVHVAAVAAPSAAITMTSRRSGSRPCSRGAMIAPTRPPSAIPAWASPMTPGAVPCRRSASVIVNSAPVQPVRYRAAGQAEDQLHDLAHRADQAGDDGRVG